MTQIKTSRMSLIAMCILSMIGLISCSNSDSELTQAPLDTVELKVDTNVVEAAPTLQRVDNSHKPIEINKETFDKLYTFIQKNGTQMRAGADYKYSFTDSKGVLYKFVAIDPMSKEHQNLEDKSLQISVWGYKNGKYDGNISNFVGYKIKQDSVKNFTPSFDSIDYDYMKRSYEDFKARVMQQ